MFYCGLDLGQTQDHTAAVIVEAHGVWPERTYAARHLEQFALGTSYPTIVQAIGALLDRAPLAGQCALVIDHTGVGVAVADLFTEAGRPYIGITITGGVSWHREPEHRNHWHVSKILLVSTVQKFLQSGRLRIGATLPHARTLQQELRDFRVKISKAANEVYSARESQNDDSVLALAISLFVAEHEGPPAEGISPAHDPEIQAARRAQGYQPSRFTSRWSGRPPSW